MSIQVDNHGHDNYKYKYDTLMSYNNADLSNLDLTLVGFFQSIAPYAITKEMRYHFPNKHNIHFNRKRARPKSIISDDAEVLKKLRACLSKITDSNFESMTEQVVKILSAKNYDWTDVSNHMYLSIIDNIFLAPIFVKLLCELETEYTKLIHCFHHIIISEIDTPKVFQDTITELGVDKSKRWQFSNSLLLVELYNQKRYSSEFMVKTINKWLESASVDNPIPLEILIKILPKCKSLELTPNVAKKLQEISQDKTYPTRLRLLLTLPQKNK
jgi:hypothetical protein